MSAKWTSDQIPDQGGRTAVVTGGNSGLGLETTRELARKGAHVVLACRDTAKGAAAATEIRVGVPHAKIEVATLDLASLDSVRAFAEWVRGEHERIDILVNNAGVMAPPRRETADGFELQIGTNHLGHFALTALLIGAMQHDGARIVTVSSGAHRMGRIQFDDLQSKRRYSRWRAYGQSKLANLMFAFELDRRLRGAGSRIRSIGAHPGYSATNLQKAAAPIVDRLVMVVTNRLLAQGVEVGVLPQLYAATNPDAEGGQYIGPDGIAEQRGYPEPVGSSSAARDEAAARRLWEVSEELTGVSFELPVGATA